MERQREEAIRRKRHRVRVMEVMGTTERPDSEDCSGQRGESGAEEEIWRGG